MVDCIGKSIADDKCGKLENNLPKDALTKVSFCQILILRSNRVHLLLFPVRS